MATEQERLNQIIERTKERAGNIVQPKLGPQHQLPLWDDLVRALPNPMARSGLFSPIGRGQRKMFFKEKLPSRSDADIFFYGKQLDEADRDVYLQALHEVRKVSLGEPVIINRAEFLKSIGRKTGKKDYQWLSDSIERLTFAMLKIVTKKYALGGMTKETAFHLIDSFYYEDDHYYMKMNPQAIVLFSQNEYAWIDWQKRFLIEKRTDMAKWLQCLICSNQKGIQRYSLGDLKEWMNYDSPMRKFKIAVKEALEELKRIKLIKKVSIEPSTKGVEQVVFTRL
jgi:hypothetical protein